MFCVVAWRRRTHHHTHRSLISDKTGEGDWAQITLES